MLISPKTKFVFTCTFCSLEGSYYPKWCNFNIVLYYIKYNIIICWPSNEVFCYVETRLTVIVYLTGVLIFIYKAAISSIYLASFQGPFNIRAGSTTSITFRNVFPHTTGFTFQVDNPLFHVTKPGENIRAHKDHRIVVGFDGNDSGSKATVMGKLIVSCAKSAGGTTSAQWVYYLKGFTPER